VSPILLKDLRESSFPIMLVIVGGLLYLGYRLGRALTFGLSLSAAWTDYVLYGLTPCVLVVVQRLLQREVQHGWPLLRQHPVRLGRLFVAKLVLGAALIALPLGIGSLLNRGAQALQTLGAPSNYDPLPGGTGVYLALVAALGVLASVLGRHAWTAALGIWVLLPHVAADSPAHPLQLARSDFDLDATPAGAWVVVAGLIALAGIAFAVRGGSGPEAWRGSWTWTDRGAFAAVALIALSALPSPERQAPLRGDVLEDGPLCVRQLRRAPEASAQVAALASRALAQLPPEVAVPQIAIEHGGGAQLEISARADVLVARVDFLAPPDPERLQRDLLHGVLDRLRPAGSRWTFVRDGFPGWALAGGRLEGLPPGAGDRARAALAVLAAEGLLEGAWTQRWQGPIRRRLGDGAARELAAWLFARAAPGDVRQLLLRRDRPLESAWTDAGFATGLAGFEAAAREGVGAEAEPTFGAPPFRLDAERYLTLTPPPLEGTLVVYTARCYDEGAVPRVFDRVEGPAQLDPWRTGPLPSGRHWLGFAHRVGARERFAGWQLVEVP